MKVQTRFSFIMKSDVVGALFKSWSKDERLGIGGPGKTPKPSTITVDDFCFSSFQKLCESIFDSPWSPAVEGGDQFLLQHRMSCQNSYYGINQVYIA